MHKKIQPLIHLLLTPIKWIKAILKSYIFSAENQVKTHNSQENFRICRFSTLRQAPFGKIKTGKEKSPTTAADKNRVLP
jgi:hypothetical protein